MSTNCALFVYLYRGVMATAQNRIFITFIYCLFVFYLICFMSTLTVQSEVNVSEKMNDVYKVFVYGTLKRGEPNHHWFSNVPGGKSRFLYQARTKEKYPLIIATDYNIPFLLYAPGTGHQVKGEVYEVDRKVLENLDILEEHPNYYVREQYEVERLDDPSKVEPVWIYTIKTFKKTLLHRPFLDSYSSQGPHGLVYVSRYLRNDTYDYKKEILC